ENSDYFRWQYEVLHALRGSFYRMFRMTMLDDSGGPALPFAELQRMDVTDRDHLDLLSRVTEYVLKGQERLADGTFCRPEPEASTVWADDLFMSVPFLLRMAEVTGLDSLYDEVAHQILRFNHYLADPETGLYFHGWYDRRKEHAPVRWGRANGWVVWATSEALLHMPVGHPAYPAILELYRSHMEALGDYQDPSGMWHQVLDHPETFLETSCTAMFTLGMARGVRMGWLEESYREKALRGWQALQEKIGPDGTVSDICRGTGIGDSVEFYENRARFDHDPRGLGAMLTAGCEIHLLNQKQDQ
ncbi:MAG: glycoside hydrolase family 88/105 protein, partial [Bacteroidales bacterium]